MDGKNGLVPWIYTALTLNIIATTILTIHTFRKNFKWLSLACILLFVAIWIDKGMGLIIPGFIPGAWGDVAEYTPTLIEIGITIGIYALGAFLFTILAKVAIDIELGRLQYTKPKKPKDIDEGTIGRKLPEIALEAEGSGGVLQ